MPTLRPAILDWDNRARAGEDPFGQSTSHGLSIITKVEQNGRTAARVTGPSFLRVVIVNKSRRPWRYRVRATAEEQRVRFVDKRWPADKNGAVALTGVVDGWRAGDIHFADNGHSIELEPLNSGDERATTRRMTNRMRPAVSRFQVDCGLSASGEDRVSSRGDLAIEQRMESRERESRMPESHVFLSYVRSDRNRVSQIHKELTAAALPVWWDVDIVPGQDMDVAIHAALTRSFAFVLCLSAVLQDRVESGVYPEVQVAIDRLRHLAPGSVFLIPVRLDECTIPPFLLSDGRSLSSIQRLDLFPESERGMRVEELVRALRHAQKQLSK